MTYIFESSRNGDIGNYATFRDHQFSTNDEEVAKKLRANSYFGSHFWEITPEVLREEMAKNPALVEQKRRGRPPKLQVVSGVRTSEVMDVK